MADQPSWRAQRREASAAHAAALARRHAADTAKARALLAEFVRQMTARGVEPRPLRAQVVGSGASYRTGISGWYLRRNRSLGTDPDGNFYVLAVPASLRARLLGVRIRPSDPPLVVGAGARDGESIPLGELLRLRLEGSDPEGP